MKKCTALLLASAIFTSGFAFAGPSPGEQTKLDALDAAINGAFLYTKSAVVYKVAIGDWNNPVNLGAGNYARWSPDGTKIAVIDAGALYVMNADGSSRTLLISGILWNTNPIEFNANGTEILYTQYNYGLRKISTSGGAPSDFATYHKYFGEPGIALTGTRAVSRVDHDLYAIDVGVGDRLYAVGCSPGVSPCGAYVMSNTATHTTLEIKDWDGSNMFSVDASTAQPDGEWDNQHWSNHPDYIAVQGETTIVGEVYIMKVSANDCTRVTWLGDCRFPDLFVSGVLTISGNITDGSLPVENRIIRATNGGQTVETQTDQNGDYLIVGFLSGSYTMSMPGADLAATGTGTQPVVISGANVTGMDFLATLRDDDTDGLDDPWEYKFFGDTTSTDGTGDDDGDGKTDEQEYIDGTNPTIAEIIPGGGGGGCGSLGGVEIAFLSLLAVAGLLKRRSISRR